MRERMRRDRSKGGTRGGKRRGTEEDKGGRR